MLLGPLVQ
ncbi:Protein of unknown function [Propionibacterium freudenreichii]|nr:Protein of unknown function [Propionibacterium freudenreichii]CEG95452.1 Protein of unknown function [Propionibacterium freudenreichii]CEG97471.1 Protein of unknown function [Propionibacterium freudenreichii]CEG99883.1 Protein of unknown function [Propionibacterium freudenreichii]CEH02277.1 Protein of unknown function [Propionibacterium freudenreichii]